MTTVLIYLDLVSQKGRSIFFQKA